MADEPAPTQTSDQTTSPSEAAPEPTALGGAGGEADAGAPKPEGDGEPKLEADKGADAAPTEGEESGEAAATPEKYELTAPEGFTLDQEAVDTATPVFKELGLTNEQAQKLMPVAADFAKRIGDRLTGDLLGKVSEERKAWLETSRSDQEIGGANWDQSLTVAAKAMDQLGFVKGSPLRNILDESGLGNHPEMIRAFVRVGKAIGEDANFVRPEHNASVKRTDAELFYPQSNGTQ
jgi:hypothetical protein